jgi:hypothetical protein
MSADLRMTTFGPLIGARSGHILPERAWRSRQERRLLGLLLTARVPTSG